MCRPLRRMGSVIGAISNPVSHSPSLQRLQLHKYPRCVFDQHECMCTQVCECVLKGLPKGHFNSGRDRHNLPSEVPHFLECLRNKDKHVKSQDLVKNQGAPSLVPGKSQENSAQPPQTRRGEPFQPSQETIKRPTPPTVLWLERATLQGSGLWKPLFSHC